MGTFEGHVLPGSAFLLWGVWHMVNIILAHVTRPFSFRTRIWYPLPWTRSRLKYLELCLVVLGASLSIAAEMVIAQPGHWMLDKDGNIPINMMAQFEHASMSLFLLLYALVALSTEGFFLPCRPLPFGMLHFLFASALAQMFLLFFFHSGDHMGVEGQYHTLLLIPIAIALACTLLELVWPKSFMLPLVRSAAMMLLGLVLIQTAFSIWVPSMIALHCGPSPEHSIWCDSEEWVHRAKGLANLQFNWWCATLLVFTIILFVVLRSLYGKGEEYNALLGATKEGQYVVVDNMPAKEVDDVPAKELEDMPAEQEEDEEKQRDALASLLPSKHPEVLL